MNCPHCSHDVSGATEFCALCGRILPAIPDRTHYTVLGYEKELLSLDPQDLEQRLFQMSKRFHPDRFAAKSEDEIRYSHDHSSAINNAYRTLKNPISRAKYAVEKELGSIEEKSAGVPADMADLFFEVHDHLDAIRDANGSPPGEAVQAVSAAEKDLREKIRRLEDDLQQKFIVYDQKPARRTIEEMKEILSHRSYIQSFLRQIDNTLGRDK